ncbi:MAG: CHAT domain-containing protein [Bacteroidota bacterium]
MKLCLLGLSLVFFQFAFFAQDSLKDGLLLADELITSGDTIKADSTFQALSRFYFESGKDSLWDICTRNHFILFWKAGNFLKSSEIAQREVARLESQTTCDSTYYYKWLSRLGYTYNRLGLYHKSIPTFEKAFFYKEKDPMAYTNKVLLPLSVAYGKLDDQETAILLSKEALEYFIEQKEHRLMNVSCNNIGEYYYLNDNLEEGLNYFQQIKFYPFVKDSWRHVANAELGKSRIYIKQDSIHLAIQCLAAFEEAFKHIEKEGLKKDELRLDGIIAQADLHLAQGELEKTNLLLQKYIDYSKAVYQNNARELAKAYNAFGDYWYTLKSFERAIEYYNEAIDLFNYEETDMQYVHARLRHVLSRSQIFLNRKSYQSSQHIIEEIEDVLELFSGIRYIYHSDKSKYILSSAMKQLSEIGIEISHQNFEESGKAEDILQALKFMEETQAIVLKEQRAIALEESLDKKTYKRFKFLRNAKRNVIHLMQEKNLNPERSSDLESELRKIEIELNSYDKIVVRNHIESNPEEWLEKLDKDPLLDGFIYYFNSGYKLFRLCYLEKELYFESIELNEDFFTQKANFKSSFDFINRNAFDKNSAQFLYRILIPEDLNFKEKNILIIPDKYTINLPFECLINGKNNYFIEETTMHYDHALTLGIDQKVSKDRNGSIAVFRPEFIQEDALVNAEWESSAIAELYSSVLHQGKEASRENFLNIQNEFSVIHISSHAFLDSSLSNSFIAFSKENLHLRELYNMNSKASLISLSACETSLGRIEGTEGSLSLSRAFSYAGIPSVVSSLWKVNDLSNARIMTGFYRNLENQSISQALTKSKKSYLRDPEIPENLKSPYFWAGMVHWGNDQILILHKEPTFSKYWFTLPVFFILILYISLIRKRAR